MSQSNDNTAPELTQMGVYVHPQTYEAWNQAIKQKHGKYRNRASQEAETALLDWANIILDERRVSIESSLDQLEGVLNSGGGAKKESHVDVDENRALTVADIPTEDAKQLNLTVRASTKSRWEAAMREKHGKYRGVSSIEAEKALIDRANLILDGSDVRPSDLRDVVDQVVDEFGDNGDAESVEGENPVDDTGKSTELVVGDDFDDDVPADFDFGTLQPGHGKRIDPARHRDWFTANGMKKSQSYVVPVLEGFLNFKSELGVTQFTENDLLDIIQTRFDVSRGTPENYLNSLQNGSTVRAHPLRDERLLRRIDEIRMEVADYPAEMDVSVMSESERAKYPAELPVLLGDAYADAVTPYYYVDDSEYAEVCITTIKSMVDWAGKYEMGNTGESDEDLGGKSKSQACVVVAKAVAEYVFSKHFEVDEDLRNRIESAATLARHSSGSNVHERLEREWAKALDLLTVVVSSESGGAESIESAEMLGVSVDADEDAVMEAYWETVQKVHSEGEFDIDDMAALKSARDALLD